MTTELSGLTPAQRAQYEAMYARMMAAFTYERVTVPGAQALAEWDRLKRAGRGWPVVIGSDSDLDRVAEQFTIDDPSISGHPFPGVRLRAVAEILAAAEQISSPEDLKKWPGGYLPGDLNAPVGDWPAKVDANDIGLSVACDLLTGVPHEKVHIVILPTNFSWHVPAYLRWGGWNACPPPEYHVATLKHWRKQYGAELIGLNGDTINIRVSNRPQARSQAMALAKEQYEYCPDIVDQGVGSISALGATLMASDWWYLWWD